jgi:hypothetical protein
LGENVYLSRWDLNKWSKGAFSCLTVDSTNDDPEILRQSVGKRVFFAGEATIYKYQGTLQGAYVTGASQPALLSTRGAVVSHQLLLSIHQAARLPRRFSASPRLEFRNSVLEGCTTESNNDPR